MQEQTIKERMLVRAIIDTALQKGETHELKEICNSNPYALHYLISITIKQHETINHIKNIISEE